MLDPKSTRVDKILSKSVSMQQNSALHCFNLAAKYRSNPRYHPQTILKNMRGAISMPSSPLGGAYGVPLTKSQSMPGLCLGTPPVESPRATSTPPLSDASLSREAPDPRCARCIEGDPELEKNCDSAWVCVDCGTVAQLAEMKSQARFKNCEKSKDTSDVADDPPAQTAQQAAYLAWSKGPESNTDKRRREMAHVGGTRMPTNKLKKHKLIDAQNVIDAEAKRNAEDMLREDGGPDQGRRKKIVRALEAVFDQLPGLDSRIRDHVRREAIRVYTNSMKHEEACGRKCCMLALSHWTNPVIAYGITEYALEALALRSTETVEKPGSPVTTIASLAPEWSEQEVQTQLRLLNDVQMQNSNQVLRMQVHSAISIIARWERDEDKCVACADDGPQAPAPHAPPRPPPKDLGVNALRLRDLILGTAASTHATSAVRDAALAQLSVPETMTFLMESGFPLDVLSISLLAVAARKLKDHDSTKSLQKHYLPKLSVSGTTVSEFVNALAGLLKLPRCQPVGLKDIF